MEEDTDILPFIIRCACILHNICIDANDVDEEEANARRTPQELELDQLARREMSALVREIGLGDAAIGDNADARVEAYKEKTMAIFDMWLANEGRDISMQTLESVYMETGFFH